MYKYALMHCYAIAFRSNMLNWTQIGTEFEDRMCRHVTARLAVKF